MKKSLLAILLFSMAFTMNAQNNDNETKGIFERKHEVRFGAVKLLGGGILEASYEYVFDSNQGLGAYLLISLDPNFEYFEKYSLTPYYRMYFQTKEDYGAKGFFAEGFTSFFSSPILWEETSSGEKKKDVFDISIGLSLGKKWINTAGFVFEFKLGAGRDLLGNAELGFLLKGDFYIGYRF